MVMPFMPEVVQVVPHENYQIDILFQDGREVCYDASSLVKKGVFKVLADKDIFINSCTVMNHTLAWDLSGNRDSTNCLDLDPDSLYQMSET